MVRSTVPNKLKNAYVRQAVREWLYHEDLQPTQAGAISPALQEQRRVAAAVEARVTFRADSREKYDPGESTSGSGVDSHNGSSSRSSSFSNANGGAGGVEQRAVLRGLTTASHGNRENSDTCNNCSSERAAERFLESHSGRSSELSSGRSLELSSGRSSEASPTNG